MPRPVPPPVRWSRLLHLFDAPGVRPHFSGNICWFPRCVHGQVLGFFQQKRRNYLYGFIFSSVLHGEQNPPMCWETDKVFRQQIQIFLSTQPRLQIFLPVL